MTPYDLLLMCDEYLLNDSSAVVECLNDLMATLFDENIESKFALELGDLVKQYAESNNICYVCGKHNKYNCNCDRN